MTDNRIPRIYTRVGGRGEWKALAMTDVNGQVLDSSRSLGMAGGMGRRGGHESRAYGGRGRATTRVVPEGVEGRDPIRNSIALR